MVPEGEHVALAPDVTSAVRGPVIECAASEPAVTDTAPAPANVYVAPAPAVTHASPAPVLELMAHAFAVAHATPAPVTELVAHAFAVTHATPAPVVELVAPAPAVAHATPARVIDLVAPAPAVRPCDTSSSDRACFHQSNLLLRSSCRGVVHWGQEGHLPAVASSCIRHYFFVVCGRVCGDDTSYHPRARKCYWHRVYRRFCVGFVGVLDLRLCCCNSFLRLLDMQQPE